MSDEEPLVIRTGAGVRTLVMDRPAARNALSSTLMRALVDTVAAAAEDDEVRAVVLTGNGPSFCGGVDMKEFGGSDSPRHLVHEFFGDLAQASGKPLIGAVNGPAMTGGLLLALHCDFLVASEQAAFADTHAAIGAMASSGMSVLLPQAVGLAAAKRMSFTGEPVPAEAAHRLGLVTEVVPHERLLETAERIAATVAGNPPRTVGAIRSTYDEIAFDVGRRGHDIERAALAAYNAGGRPDWPTPGPGAGPATGTAGG